jgi:hypothetical protein
MPLITAPIFLYLLIIPLLRLINRGEGVGRGGERFFLLAPARNGNEEIRKRMERPRQEYQNNSIRTL